MSDADSKTWTITNPDAITGHEGQHVTLTAHVPEDKRVAKDGEVTARRNNSEGN